MFSTKRLVLLTAFALVSAIGKSAAQCTTCDGDVKVDFKGALCIDGSFTLQLHDKTTIPATGANCGYAYSPPLPEKVKLKPDKAYTLTLTAIPSGGGNGGVSSVHLEVTCPPCYKVYIDGEETSVYDGNEPGCGTGQGLTKTFTVIIKPNSSGGTGSGGDGNVSAGSSSGGLSGDFSLGGLTNGSAGAISFSLGTITPDLFMPGVLNYESVSPDVDGGQRESIPVPITLRPRLWAVNEQIYLGLSGGGVLRVNPETKAWDLLADSKRRPAQGILDDCSPYQVQLVGQGPHRGLCAMIDSVYRFDEKVANGVGPNVPIIALTRIRSIGR